MKKAQLVRLTSGGRGPPPPPAAVLLSPPIISSTAVQVGVVQSVTGGTYQNVVGLPTYEWEVDLVEVGDTDTHFTPAPGDEGEMITVVETVIGEDGVPLVTRSAAVGPILAAATPPGEASVFTPFTGGSMTLDTALPAGTFLFGEPWVVLDEPANLIATVPPAVVHAGKFDDLTNYTNRVVHGLMVDPGRGVTGGQTSGLPDGWQQAFDSLDSNQATSGSTILDYNAALQRDPGLFGPLPLVANTVLVKARSTLTPNKEGRQNVVDLGSLTVLTTAPPANSFAPHPTDANKTPLFTADDVDVSWLPNLPVPAGQTVPSAASVVAFYNKMWQTFFTNNLFTRSINALNNMPHTYGTDLANMEGLTMSYLCLNAWTGAEKLSVMTAFCRLGIDLGRRAVNGGEFPSKLASFGGGSHWFKAPIIVAARALRDANNSAAVAELERIIDYNQTKIFSDDLSQFYLTRERMEAVRDTPDPTYDATPYEHYAEGTPEWFSNPSNYNGGGMGWNVKYRLTYCPSHTGVILGLRLMGLESTVNSPALFDWGDRWVNWVALNGTGDLNVPSEYPAFIQAMVATYWPAYPAPAPVLQRIVARDDLIWFQYDKLLDLRSVPPTSAFAVTVNGSPATLTQSGIFGYSMFVRRNLFLAGGETVMASYTQPGSNKARTLALTNVASVSSSAATNLTNTLPPPATVRQRLDNAADDAHRQVFGTVRVPATAGQGLITGVDRLLLVMRVRFNAFAANDAFMGNSTGSTSALKGYLASVVVGGAVAPRLTVTSNTLRAPAMLHEVNDRGVLVTMAFAMDFTQTGVTNKYRAAVARPTGQTSISTSSSTDPAAGTTIDMGAALLGGISLLGNMATLSAAPDAHLEFAYLDYGRSADGYTLPASLTSANFAHDFDPGGNGQNITGTAPWFFWAGTAAEANSIDGLPGRGRSGAFNMYPKREPHVYPIVAAA